MSGEGIHPLIPPSSTPFNDLRLPLLRGSPEPAGGKFPFRATNFDVGVEKAKVVLEWGPGSFLMLTVLQPRDGAPRGGGAEAGLPPPCQRPDTPPPSPVDRCIYGPDPWYLWKLQKAPKRRVYRTPPPRSPNPQRGKTGQGGRSTHSSLPFLCNVFQPDFGSGNWKIWSKIRTRLVSPAMKRSVWNRLSSPKKTCGCVDGPTIGINNLQGVSATVHFDEMFSGEK